jgi:hypothetical protein
MSWVLLRDLEKLSGQILFRYNPLLQPCLSPHIGHPSHKISFTSWRQGTYMSGERHLMTPLNEPLVIDPTSLRMNSPELTGAEPLTLNINLSSHAAFFGCC